MNSLSPSFFCIFLSFCAYSIALFRSWIEQGPVITTNLLSLPFKMLQKSVRPFAIVSVAFVEAGINSRISRGEISLVNFFILMLSILRVGIWCFVGLFFIEFCVFAFCTCYRLEMRTFLKRPSASRYNLNFICFAIF